jgi:hypothetical protein
MQEVVMVDKVKSGFWGPQIEGVMKEIGRQASICHVRILDPGVIEAVLHNDEAACGSTNPMAFKKMREALMMGFVVREKAFERLGAEDATELVTQIRAAMTSHFGGKLGGSGSHE